MSSKFHLKVAGSQYSGWTSLRYTNSIEQLAPSMSVQLTDRWTEEMEPIPIESGNPFTVFIEDEKVITGYIDQDEEQESATTHQLSFTGRAKTGDLVDCAAIKGNGRWRNRDLLKIAKDLCAPFNIEVSTKVDLGAALSPSFSIDDGETVFECLSRAARMRAVLLCTDAEGNLFFDRVSTKRIKHVLQYGHNILTRQHSNDWSQRFSDYKIKSQSAGGDSTFGSAAASIKKTVEDEGVNRYRPTILHSSNESNGVELKKRVTWERNVRAGRSKRLRYTVLGWRHSGGLWTPNTLVRVVDPRIETDDDLLVSGVNLTRDNQGEKTTLELGIPEAFSVEPLPKPSPRKKNTSYWSSLRSSAANASKSASKLLSGFTDG